MGEQWKELLKGSIRDVKGIKQHFSLSEEECLQMEQIIGKYPVCVNEYYLGLINKNDADDPIRKMCIPQIHEFSEGGQNDTSGEKDNTVLQGMQHKYRQTALILSTNQCATYCRHCFRKRLVGSSSDEIATQLPVMADYVRNHNEINNVLISGGDSFMNPTATIENYLRIFSAIPTLDFIRFGTRIPVVLPQRITEDSGLLGILRDYCEKKQIIIVTQYNHPRELTPESVRSIKLLMESGCVVRNQSVLLKGVNDDHDVISELMNRLVACGIIPYYIFQCRPVEGVKNQFQISLSDGLEIIDEAKLKMNGQAKSVRFVLSHPTGKIEIIGKSEDGSMIFKYHQAKNERDNSRVFTKKLDDGQCWLFDI